jgi:ATP-binding cassette subfamily B protein
MTLKNRYSLPDLVAIPFAAAPVLTALCIVEQFYFAVLPSAEIIVTARFIDTALAIFNGQGGNIITPLLLLMGIIASNHIIPALMNFVRSKRNMRLTETFRVAVVEKRAKLEYRHIEHNDTWELIQRVGADPSGKISGGFDNILSFAGIIVKVTAVLLVLAVQVWWAALVIVALSAPLLFLATKTGKANYEAGKDASKYERRAKYLQEVLTGRDNVEERSLFGYTGGINKTWYEKYEAGRKIKLKAEAKRFIIMKGSSLITLSTAILIVGVLIAPLGSGAITIGMFMGLVNATFNLIQMMSWDLSWRTGELAVAREYLKDLSAFSVLGEQEGAISIPEPPETEPESIEFIDVNFRYPGTEKDILKGLSLRLEHGRHYAFVGSNGAGKTTITKLLTGLYTNYEGKILIDGVELRELPQAGIKALFAVVYQDFAKYQIPLKDSAALGAVRPGAENGAGVETVIEALKKIGLESLLAELPKGMDTPLGKIREGGVDISGGQWQRVAIARSLVSPAPVHILDEPTAALDPVAESALYELYGGISRGKTTVFITHRLGAARLADEILVIDGGRVSERGSHDALMAEKGLYAEMFESQRGWYSGAATTAGTTPSTAEQPEEEYK